MHQLVNESQFIQQATTLQNEEKVQYMFNNLDSIEYCMRLLKVAEHRRLSERRHMRQHNICGSGKGKTAGIKIRTRLPGLWLRTGNGLWRGLVWKGGEVLVSLGKCSFSWLWQWLQNCKHLWKQIVLLKTANFTVHKFSFNTCNLDSHLKSRPWNYQNIKCYTSEFKEFKAQSITMILLKNSIDNIFNSSFSL